MNDDDLRTLQNSISTQASRAVAPAPQQSGGLQSFEGRAIATPPVQGPVEPSTWGANGLDTVTGWANGVQSNGSGGFTYNGINVNSDGSRIEQGPIDTSNPNPGAWTPSPVAPAQPAPPEYTAYSLDFPKYSPIQQTPDYANRIGPGYQPAARPTAPTVPNPRIAQSFGGMFDPNNASYPTPGIPTDQLGHGQSALDILKGAAGDVYSKATTSLLPASYTADLPDKWYLPVKQTVEGIYSPLGLATLPFGGQGVLNSAVRNVGAIAAGSAASGAADQYLPQNMPGRGLAVAGAGLAGGIAGYGAAGAIAKRAPGAISAADRAAVGASNRFMEPAGGPTGHAVTNAMADANGWDTTPEGVAFGPGQVPDIPGLTAEETALRNARLHPRAEITNDTGRQSYWLKPDSEEELMAIRQRLSDPATPVGERVDLLDQESAISRALAAEERMQQGPYSTAGMAVPKKPLAAGMGGKPPEPPIAPDTGFGSPHDPGSWGTDPTLPSRFSLRQGAPEVGTRPGELLKPKGPEQLGAGYKPKDVLGVATDLNRQVNSQANVLRAEAKLAADALGERITAVDGNVYLKDVPASPAERALGHENALAVRVLERPKEYNLTPEQSAAVAKLASIPEAIKNERAIFGVKPNELALEEGQNYFHRTATKPAIERTDNVVQDLVNGAPVRKGIMDYGESGGGSSRLAIGKDKGRLVADPIDFVKRGGVYADPIQALDQNVTQGLSKAANAHIKSLLEPFAQTSADRVSPEFRAAIDKVRSDIASQDGRLQTAERRAGIATGQAKELATPLERLRVGVVDKPTARAALKDATKELTQARRDAMKEVTQARQDALAGSRGAGGATVKDQAATAAFRQAQSRADAALQALKKAQATALGLDEIAAPGIRLPAPSAAAIEKAVAAADLSTKELRQLARNVKMPISAEAASNATMLQRGAAEIGATNTAAALRGAETSAVNTPIAAVVNAAKDIAPEDVYTTMRQMQRRADVLSARGGKWSGLADSIQQELAKTQAKYDEMLPQWKKTIEASKNIPADRAAVNQRLAPALIGSDFEKKVAKQIERFYGRTATSDTTQSGAALVKARAINTALIPAKATMDISSLINQQGRMIIMDPKGYAVNVARSLRDVVYEKPYNELMSSDMAKRAASRGLVLMGESGQREEFLFNNWFERIPGVGKGAQWANKQYSAFNNRQRLTAFESWTDAAKVAGKPLDAAAEEQVSRGLNRMTGISTSRAGDLEQLAEFAPNFLRSHFENIAHALTDKGIEGQIARRYLGSTFAVGTMAIGGAAMAQGRDPSEVLSPFDLKALKQGNLRWNSNFGTIRLAGQDWGVYGPYTSLARLAAVASSGFLDSVKEQDARPFLTALMDIPSTKGSPVLKFGIDTVKGQTFAGNSPTDLSPSGLLNGALDMVLPISIASAIQDRQKGLSWHDTILDTIANAIGENSNPVTPYEKKNQELQDAFPGRDVSSLTPMEINKFNAEHPNSAVANYQSTNPQAVAAAKDKAEFIGRVTTFQQGNDNQYIDPATNAPKTPADGPKWREANKQTKAMQDEYYAGHPYTGPASADPGGYYAALDARRAAIKQATTNNIVDYDKVDAWERANPDVQAKVDAYYADPNKPNTDLTPAVTASRAASTAVGDAGLFQVRDDAWARVAKSNPKLQAYKSFDDYEAAQQPIVEARFAKAPPAMKDTMIKSALSSDPVANIFTALNSQGKLAWVKAHPQEAAIAAQWGYLTPTAIEKLIIAQQGAP